MKVLFSLFQTFFEKNILRRKRKAFSTSIIIKAFVYENDDGVAWLSMHAQLP